MIFNKFQRIVAKIIVSVVLLGLPLFSQLHYIIPYYIVVLALILFQILLEFFNWEKKLDEKFYVRWSKSRKNGIWINCILNGLRSFIFMVVMVSIGQFFVNGRTPIDIVVNLPSSALTKILIVLVVFNSIIGIGSWSENEKRYNRISEEKNN